jgi:hypothetical protein
MEKWKNGRMEEWKNGMMEVRKIICRDTTCRVPTYYFATRFAVFWMS